jgi:hypothetical protein
LGVATPTDSSTGAGLLFGDYKSVVAESKALATGMIVDPMERAFEVDKHLVHLDAAQRP